MEIWIVIGAFLAFGFIGYLGCVASEMNKWMRQRHLMEHPEFFSRTYDVSADEIRKALDIYKTSKVTTHLPTGEVETLGPGKVFIFDKQKVGKATGIVNEEEMVDEAEKLIKEARERCVRDIG